MSCTTPYDTYTGYRYETSETNSRRRANTWKLSSTRNASGSSISRETEAATAMHKSVSSSIPTVHDVDLSGQIDRFLICMIYSRSSSWCCRVRPIYSAWSGACFSGLALYGTDHAGEGLDDLLEYHDTSVRRCKIYILPSLINLSHKSGLIC